LALQEWRNRDPPPQVAAHHLQGEIDAFSPANAA
jgi:hypothetical protein